MEPEGFFSDSLQLLNRVWLGNSFLCSHHSSFVGIAVANNRNWDTVNRIDLFDEDLCSEGCDGWYRGETPNLDFSGELEAGKCGVL